MGGDVGVLLKSAAFWLKVRVPWRYSTCFSFRQGLIWVGLDSGKGGGGVHGSSPAFWLKDRVPWRYNTSLFHSDRVWFG